MERWRGKVAVVTGAGSGMGRAIAQQLAEHGVKVVGLDIQFLPVLGHKKPNVTYQSIQICDITKPENVVKAFKSVEETLGGVDILVNCAGCLKAGHITNVGDHPLSEDELMWTYDVNIKAMVMCTRHAVNSMVRRGIDGHIININSLAGHYVPFSDQMNVYSSTKHAVTAFTHSLAVELATCKSKIKTTSLSPGLVKSPLSVTAMADMAAAPSLEPTDIAAAVVTVLSAPPHVNITEMTVQPVGELRR